jgi:hypothetical protein
MTQYPNHNRFTTQVFIIVGILAVGAGLLIGLVGLALWPTEQNGASYPAPTEIVQVQASEVPVDQTQLPTPTPIIEVESRPSPTPTSTPTKTPTSTATPTKTPTSTATLDLDQCNAAGCGAAARPLPTAQFNADLFLTEKKPTRRFCPQCPKNEQLTDSQLNALIGVDPATLAQLKKIVLSQETYPLAPGIVYLVFNNVHHVVIDLKESGYRLRNIIPNTPERGTLITPSYCLSPKSLLVTTADYHGLNGSNKTERGRDLFFHLGRAVLYQRNGRYNIDVVRTRPAYDKISVAWGGGPLFIWNGQYQYNPEREWFDEENLEHYRTTHWTKITASISKDRKYLFMSVSYGLTLREHAENIIELGKRWAIKVDRAMRFDGSESAYMAIRFGKYLVPILNLEEPLIVNCFAIEEP